MYKKILGLLLSVLLCLLPIGANATASSSPEQLVAEFQKLPHYEMFCKDERWRGVVPDKLDTKFKAYFSTELYKLFLWFECVKPVIPPHYDGLFKAIYYDIRFSIPYGELNLETENFAKDFRISIIKNDRQDERIVGVNFTHRKTKMFTRYTLIREDGLWKIDDISPRSTFVGKREPSDPDGNEIAEYSFSSDSIKAEMQKNYNAAMARYNKEQAQKGISPK